MFHEPYQFNHFFKSIECPIDKCVNCFCNYCINNVEGKVNQKEYQNLTEENLCFNCDECKQYTGNSNHRMKDKILCMNFKISDYGIQTNRRRLKEWNQKQKQTINKNSNAIKEKQNKTVMSGQLDLFWMLEQ